jgi:protease-4
LRIALILSMFAALTGCTMFPINLVSEPRPLREVTIRPGSGSEKILLLDIDGIITSASRSGVLMDFESPVAYLKERLNLAILDRNIKAVVVRINSPGGGVTASDIMYDELNAYREKAGIPVVACFMDVVASGGYYIAMATDEIVCHPTCVTGSIGVIAQLATIDKMLEKLGIEPLTIKSGKHKDIGSPFRDPTESEKEIMQKMIDSMYERFVNVVAEGRKMEAEKVRVVADGRIYDAQEALELGLVDSIGYIRDAIETAEKRANLKHARVVMYERPGSYKTNVYSAEMTSGESSLSALAERILPDLSARFYYLWLPGR